MILSYRQAREIVLPHLKKIPNISRFCRENNRSRTAVMAIIHNYPKQYPKELLELLIHFGHKAKSITAFELNN